MYLIYNTLRNVVVSNGVKRNEEPRCKTGKLLN